jgi:hypothetical protein
MLKRPIERERVEEGPREGTFKGKALSRKAESAKGFSGNP